jgi:hypothetical protein
MLQGKLRDGYKIVVFNASFEVKEKSAVGLDGRHSSGGGGSGGGGRGEGGLSKESVTMRLMLNGVRIARADARLGFVRPSCLSQGIALRSVVSGKGVLWCCTDRQAGRQIGSS